MSEQRNYTCDRCAGHFMSDWSDADAAAEYEREFGKEAVARPFLIVCDPCYQRLLILTGRSANENRLP